MIVLYIYDEDLQNIKWIQHILEKYIIIEALSIKMIQSTQEILTKINQSADVCGIYFIRDNQCGIQLAQQIRQADALGKIIFFGNQ